MKRRLAGTSKNFLQNKSSGANVDNLKLIHVTSIGSARQILEDGQLTVCPCPVFNVDLNYFFLLRPAYKLKNAEEKQSIIDFFPVVFIFKPEKIGHIYHAYPFDTGGASKGAFASARNPWAFLDDFELSPDIQSVADHINWAFTSRREYFDGNLSQGTISSIPDWDSGPHSFFEIAKLAQHGHNQPDLRASSIEIAYKNNISLINNVELAILPKQFIEDPRGNNMIAINNLKRNKIKWTFYDWQPNQRPSDFHQKIQSAVRRHLIARKSI